MPVARLVRTALAWRDSARTRSRLPMGPVATVACCSAACCIHWARFGAQDGSAIRTAMREAATLCFTLRRLAHDMDFTQ
jgi:hypothetical protein